MSILVSRIGPGVFFIRALAAALRDQERGYARGFKDTSTAVAKVNAIADLLVNDAAPDGSVVAALESPVIQDLWRQKGLKGRLEDLRPRATTELASLGAEPRQDGSQLFDGSYQGKWVNQKGTDFDVRMDLQRNGETVVGRWTFGPNRVTVEGIVSDGRLYFDWKWGEDYFGEGELYRTAVSPALGATPRRLRAAAPGRSSVADPSSNNSRRRPSHELNHQANSQSGHRDGAGDHRSRGTRIKVSRASMLGG